MKTMPVMELRRHLGEVLDLVRLTCETVIVERAGKPVARLCPIGGESEAVGGSSLRLRAIEQLAGLGGRTARGKAVERWLNRERATWDARP
ncbi:MAG: type II toxin-antitoxin system Phd/YefM family antitoxin [Kiritimatiellae bacterium]|nr:type II toxin-antitoxin system Phd/YefM family antitoxin [Kiritimatiellia bacterium]